jgi:glycosyltransferase involved in cell wall biosynthesis
MDGNAENSDVIEATTTKKVKAGSSDLPKISCIMPTRNRRIFLPQAISYFLKQNYANKELVIIDDGDDVSDIIQSHSSIHYYHLKSKHSVGEKRNIACNKARGDYIAHWDDDDWHAPDRLAIQLSSLIQSKSKICGLRNLYYYCPATGKAWLYEYSGSDRWIAGGTFFYNKAITKDYQFANINSAEDTGFLKSIPQTYILELNNNRMYVGVIHKLNTSQKSLDNPQWREIPLGIVSKLLANDRDFYVQLRNDLIQARNDNATFLKPVKSHEIQRNNLNRLNQVLGGFDEQKYGNPMVSCIMPTYNRPMYVIRSVHYFLNQSYRNSELIIVDDSEQSIENEIPKDSRIKIIRLSQRFSIGKKRNLGCELASGDIIMLWDDDDWHGPKRIEKQVMPLLSGKYYASGIGTYLYYSLHSRRFSKFKSEVFFQGIVGGTLTFWKEFWEHQTRFSDISLAEDVELQKSLIRQGAKIKRVMDNDIFFILRHENNTWSFDDSEHSVEATSIPDFIPREDLFFYGVL